MTLSTATWIRQLDPAAQAEIRQNLEQQGLSPEDIETAMDSRIDDLV